MDLMRDLVRDRTADLQRVAAGVRRERDLRSPVTADRAARAITRAGAGMAAASPTASVAGDRCDGSGAPSGARQAA